MTISDPPPNPAPPAGPMREPAHRVSPRARGWWALRAAIPWLVVLLLVVGALILDPGARAWSALPVVLVLLAAAHVLVMPRWRFAFHRWEVTPVAIYAQTGWVTRTRVLIPMSRVQVIDTVAGPVERIFGLATVTVTTASSAGKVHIPGLERGVADAIAASLAISTGSQDDDAT